MRSGNREKPRSDRWMSDPVGFLCRRPDDPEDNCQRLGITVETVRHRELDLFELA